MASSRFGGRFFELISNACRFVEDGERYVVWARKREKIAFSLSWKDTGPGWNKLSRRFQVFL